MPDLALENSIKGQVCGIDEVGRGPLAGPVVAAAVYIPEFCYDLAFLSDLRDSKKLSASKLDRLDALIRTHFVFSLSEVSPERIDEINILQASLLVMADAQKSLSQITKIDHALIDGNRCPENLSCEATSVIKGDMVSQSIAAASIIAKVYRDKFMRNLSFEFPHYHWESNVGYPTQSHLRAIDIHGITPHHRKSFAPVRRFLDSGSTKKILV